VLLLVKSKGLEVDLVQLGTSFDCQAHGKENKTMRSSCRSGLGLRDVLRIMTGRHRFSSITTQIRSA
jgi:hypothetical protein